MPQHWTEKLKHKAKDAFDRVPDQEPVNQPPPPQRPPQPRLRPKGPMRGAVDAQVHEKEAAKRAHIEKRRQEIEAKLERDRVIERSIVRQ